LPLARTSDGLLADDIHFDVSAIVTLMPGSPLEQEYMWTMHSAGIDRLLLGSDFPQYTLEQNPDALEQLPLTGDGRAKARFGNARTLSGLAD